MQIKTVLVPQGAEYKAVCRGLRTVAGSKPNVLSIPVGIQPTTARLKQLQHQEPLGNCLLMGLGGSLVSPLKVGDAVLGNQCWASVDGEFQPIATCDPVLTSWVKGRLGEAVRLGTVVSCDRILCTPQEKHQVHQTTQADVVDMESSAVLSTLSPNPVAILRIISDTHSQTLPDIASALSPTGELKPLALATSFLKQPIAAQHLIRSSLQSLKQLETITHQLFLGN